MKKIINGKKYDTEKAEMIAEYWNGLGTDDFDNITEKLYRTKKGNWFLWGSGGAFTDYAVLHGNSTSGSSDIRALTAKEALDWCTKTDNVEAAEKYFSEEIEDA